MMRGIIPEVKQHSQEETYTRIFDSFQLDLCEPELYNIEIKDAQEILKMKFWNYKALQKEGQNPITIRVEGAEENLFSGAQNVELARKQGYLLRVQEHIITISCMQEDGYKNALSTLKQLVEKREESFCIRQVHICDWPTIEYRSLSTTFAWYAGYGRYGFDMQLWGLTEWKEFLYICSDYKINQLNLCLYGYWPFEMPEYPESVLKGLSMKLWNPESENWVEVEYKHPNIAQEFLPELIATGHRLGIKFFAYIGLNSYSGGYANAHREKRMKLPQESKFINDFDSLCLSDPGTLEYLKKCMGRIVAQGFDGIDFEESEEAYWYCNCKACKNTFQKGQKTPEETLHAANTMLLQLLYETLKELKPDIVIGIRAWRQPPLVRDDSLIQEMVQSVPQDIVLFWAPGQYVADSEFEKWVAAFGRERIRARDTEAIGFAAGLGRLVRPFRFNGLRTEEEPITQYIEEDIRQHRGSAKLGVAGINGYLFEWYGFFMAFFAHACYGWGEKREPEDFYSYVLTGVFGEMADDIQDVMKNMLTIHESQLSIFELEFPFAKNKVQERDIPRIKQAIADYPRLTEKLSHIMTEIKKDEKMAPFGLHFKKWKVSLERSRIIYDMGLACIAWEKATTQEEKRAHLLQMLWLNEREFDVIKANYFDVNPVAETGVKSCMIPYHELKRILKNKLNEQEQEQKQDKDIVYLGVESLGWMWF